MNGVCSHNLDYYETIKANYGFYTAHISYSINFHSCRKMTVVIQVTLDTLLIFSMISSPDNLNLNMSYTLICFNLKKFKIILKASGNQTDY